MRIRKATPGDVVEITQIYNDAVSNTVATFDTELFLDGEAQLLRLVAAEAQRVRADACTSNAPTSLPPPLSFRSCSERCAKSVVR